MNTFIINDRGVSVDLHDGKATLKTIRQNLNLRGIKEVCGEGDCGACMVLLGENKGETLNYKAVNSCLLPTGELGGKHVVTIEGLNQERLSLIQETFVKEFAAQCGFCTPGFIVALTGFLLSTPDLDKDEAIQSISGNMCRCTGYVSIKRALFSILEKLNVANFKNTKPGSSARRELLIKENILPLYFSDIQEKIKNIQVVPFASSGKTVIAGGTDICVQKKGELEDTEYSFLSQRSDLREIKMEQGKCFIGGAVTFEELRNSEALEKIFPDGKKVFRLIASLPIRNRATIAGNIVNASPIGDMTIFLLALDAMLLLSDGVAKREVKLRDFFKGYKQMDKKEDEIIEWITFDMPKEHSFLRFEKVSKRKYLDIASVNTATCITVKENTIKAIGLSAGGVGPFPLYLSKTCDFLKGKKIEEAVIDEAVNIADSEISPISDTRGSEKYKRLLLSQLIRMHFIKLF
ncbi:MAG: FAD binding domain-containing protein [Candidatus Parcubacteria bacterium]|nr:FAD binding domain-containing protein [Candidatus Parcubacteria bacterium]